MDGCKAGNVMRNEAYFSVRRNDECQAQHSKQAFFNNLLLGLFVFFQEKIPLEL